MSSFQKLSSFILSYGMLFLMLVILCHKFSIRPADDKEMN